MNYDDHIYIYYIAYQGMMVVGHSDHDSIIDIIRTIIPLL